ncbi:MAG: Maf family protein [Alphaproteobacteria bacterium]|nr:Maf family protein [Alphaproteobacteria bacterium]
MPTPSLILASSSPSRRQLLSNAGLTFEVQPPGVDEEEAKRSLLSGRTAPQGIAEKLAEMKAMRISAKHPEAMVVGGDSTLACQGRLFDKPPSMEAARKQLLALRGQTHELFSCVVVARGGTRLWHWNERARLTMRPFNEAFLDAYLARAGDAVLGSVGAYQLEGLGAHLFSRVDGDYFTILGLPLLPLLSFLAGHGIGLGRAA